MSKEIKNYIDCITDELSYMYASIGNIKDLLIEINKEQTEPTKKRSGIPFKESISAGEYIFMRGTWNYWFDTKLEYFEPNVPCTTQKQFTEYMNIVLNRKHAPSTYIKLLRQQHSVDDFTKRNFAPVTITIEDVQNVSESNN